MRFFDFALTALLTLGAAPFAVASAPDATVARIHWIGTDQLISDKNTAYLAAIFNHPESVRLKNQTLDMLSTAPWRLSQRSADTNRSKLLVPLLDDVVRHECFLEIRRANTEPGQAVFAVRVGSARGGLWQTNLASALGALTGIIPAPVPDNPQAWTLQKHHQPKNIQFTRAGDWVLLGAAQDQNALFAQVAARLRRGEAPDDKARGGDCLQAMVDFPRLSEAIRTNWAFSARWPKIELSVSGEGTNIHTRAQIKATGLPPVQLTPWNIPISLMDGPQFSFTAARGFKNWLESLQAWKDLKIGPAPNQVFAWALSGEGMNSYAAAPLADASNTVARVTDRVLQKWGAFFATNEVAKFQRAQTFNGLEWQGFPWLAPTLESRSTTNGNFVVGRLFPLMPTDPPPQGYYDQVMGDPNLVYYDRELTYPRTQQWLYIGQFARVVFGRPQMPSGCLSLAWLKAIGPSLGTTVTRITTTSPGEFGIDRTSTIGFTGIELHLLADWLESPELPVGIHTLTAPTQ
jgi:hypothetical protein